MFTALFWFAPLICISITVVITLMLVHSTQGCHFQGLRVWPPQFFPPWTTSLSFWSWLTLLKQSRSAPGTDCAHVGPPPCPKQSWNRASVSAPRPWFRPIATSSTRSLRTWGTFAALFRPPCSLYRILYQCKNSTSPPLHHLTALLSLWHQLFPQSSAFYFRSGLRSSCSPRLWLPLFTFFIYFLSFSSN